MDINRIGSKGYSSGIIAAVFQPPEAFQQPAQHPDELAAAAVDQAYMADRARAQKLADAEEAAGALADIATRASGGAIVAIARGDGGARGAVARPRLGVGIKRPPPNLQVTFLIVGLLSL